MVDASGQVLNRAPAKLVDPEDHIVDISDPIYVVLKDVYAERMEEIWLGERREMLYCWHGFLSYFLLKERIESMSSVKLNPDEKLMVI